MNGQFARAYLGIGEVLVELRGEFPDISVSKIRFLESEGLISPARSPSGYGRFGPADVDQLRFILTAQRDQYLPLRVIKERLRHGEAAQPAQSQAINAPHAAEASPASQSDRGTQAALEAQGFQNAARSRMPGYRDQPEMISRRDLLDLVNIDEQQLAELETHGLVRRVGRLYSQDALDVAATIAGLAAHGVQARHLRTARTAADRDVSLIEQLVAPILRQRSPQAKAAAGQAAREIAVLLLRLHSVLVDAALTEAGLGGPPGHDPGMHEAGRPAGALARDGVPRPGVEDASA